LIQRTREVTQIQVTKNCQISPRVVIARVYGYRRFVLLLRFREAAGFSIYDTEFIVSNRMVSVELQRLQKVFFRDIQIALSALLASD
jgi:hypothetical protein